MCGGGRVINRRTHTLSKMYLDIHICIFWTGTPFPIDPVIALANSLFNSKGIYIRTKSSVTVTGSGFATIDATQTIQNLSDIREEHVKAAGGIVVAFVDVITNFGDACGVGGPVITTTGDVSAATDGLAVVNPDCTDWAFAHEIAHVLGVDHVCEQSQDDDLPLCVEANRSSLMFPQNVFSASDTPVFSEAETTLARSSKLLLPS